MEKGNDREYFVEAVFDPSIYQKMIDRSGKTTHFL